MAKIGGTSSTSFKIWESPEEVDRKRFVQCVSDNDKRKTSVDEKRDSCSADKIVQKITKFPRRSKLQEDIGGTEIPKKTPETSKIPLDIPQAPVKMRRIPKKLDAIPKRLQFLEAEDENVESMDSGYNESHVAVKHRYPTRGSLQCQTSQNTIPSKDSDAKPKSKKTQKEKSKKMPIGLDKENDMYLANGSQPRQDKFFNRKRLSKQTVNLPISKNVETPEAGNYPGKQLPTRDRDDSAIDSVEWIQSQWDVGGTWIECSHKNCRKWRFEKNYHDTLEVPEVWYCNMCSDSRFANCAAPEQQLPPDDNVVMNKYSAGGIVWARINGYPWWPAMVDDCPDLLRYYETCGNSNVPNKYHVTFFNEERAEHAWISTRNLKSYVGNPRDSFPKKTKFGGKDYSKELDAVCELATLALDLTILERLKRFSLASKFFRGNTSQPPPKKRRVPKDRTTRIRSRIINVDTDTIAKSGSSSQKRFKTKVTRKPMKRQRRISPRRSKKTLPSKNIEISTEKDDDDSFINTSEMDNERFLMDLSDPSSPIADDRPTNAEFSTGKETLAKHSSDVGDVIILTSSKSPAKTSGPILGNATTGCEKAKNNEATRSERYLYVDKDIPPSNRRTAVRKDIGLQRPVIRLSESVSPSSSGERLGFNSYELESSSIDNGFARSSKNTNNSSISFTADEFAPRPRSNAGSQESVAYSRSSFASNFAAAHRESFGRSYRAKKKSRKNPIGLDKENDMYLANGSQPRQDTFFKRKRLSKQTINLPISKNLETPEAENYSGKQLPTRNRDDPAIDSVEWIQSQWDVGGTWIECCHKNCRKWRFEKNYRDTLEVPEVWYCNMSSDSRFANCAAPEQQLPPDDNVVMNKYSAGSIVWALINGYPWWPAMVDDCPDLLRYYETRENSNIPNKYHVTFFNEKRTEHAWISTRNLKSYVGNPRESFLKKTKFRGKDYSKELDAVCELAVEALNLTILERLKRFSSTLKFFRDNTLQPPSKKRRVSKNRTTRIRSRIINVDTDTTAKSASSSQKRFKTKVTHKPMKRQRRTSPRRSKKTLPSKRIEISTEKDDDDSFINPSEMDNGRFLMDLSDPSSPIADDRPTNTEFSIGKETLAKHSSNVDDVIMLISSKSSAGTSGPILENATTSCEKAKNNEATRSERYLYVDKDIPPSNRRTAGRKDIGLQRPVIRLSESVSPPSSGERLGFNSYEPESSSIDNRFARSTESTDNSSRSFTVDEFAPRPRSNAGSQESVAYSRSSFASNFAAAHRESFGRSYRAASQLEKRENSSSQIFNANDFVPRSERSADLLSHNNRNLTLYRNSSRFYEPAVTDGRFVSFDNEPMAITIN